MNTERWAVFYKFAGRWIVFILSSNERPIFVIWKQLRGRPLKRGLGGLEVRSSGRGNVTEA